MSQRHQLIYIKKNSNFDLISPHQNKPAVYGKVHEWIKHGRPCIFTRQSSDNQSIVRLGLPVLVDNTTQRAAIHIDKACIERESPLPKLIELEQLFTQPIKKIVLSESIHVYGSFLFQHLSNESFVHPNSDLDLLIDYKETSLFMLQHKMAELAIVTGRVIDSEVRFKTIGDISLNELITATTPELLTKTPNAVKLISRQELYEHYPTLSN